MQPKEPDTPKDNTQTPILTRLQGFTTTELWYGWPVGLGGFFWVSGGVRFYLEFSLLYFRLVSDLSVLVKSRWWVAGRGVLDVILPFGVDNVCGVFYFQ